MSTKNTVFVVEWQSLDLSGLKSCRLIFSKQASADAMKKNLQDAQTLMGGYLTCTVQEVEVKD